MGTDIGDSIEVEVVTADDILGPQQMTSGASGADLRYSGSTALTLAPPCSDSRSGVHIERLKIPTGVHVAIPAAYEGQVRGRSGLTAKGLVVPIGTIDSDYRGEIFVVAYNMGAAEIRIQPGDRIAQLVLSPVLVPRFKRVASLPTTARAASGFGHTGR